MKGWLKTFAVVLVVIPLGLLNGGIIGLLIGEGLGMGHEESNGWYLLAALVVVAAEITTFSWWDAE